MACAKRHAAAVKGALARAEAYRSGRIERRAQDKGELNKRRYHRLRKQGRCVRCMAKAGGPHLCSACSRLRRLKARAKEVREAYEAGLRAAKTAVRLGSTDNSTSGEP